MKGLLIITFIMFSSVVFAQNQFGIRLNKSIGGYGEHGFVYQRDSVLGNFDLKAQLISSRLGSAIFNNAIKQEQITLGVQKAWFQDKSIELLLALNTGYFRTDYGSEIFDVLDNDVFFIAPEFGVKTNKYKGFDIGVSFLYNLGAGDGISGPGSLFSIQTGLFITKEIGGKDE